MNDQSHFEQLESGAKEEAFFGGPEAVDNPAKVLAVEGNEVPEKPSAQNQKVEENNLRSEWKERYEKSEEDNKLLQSKIKRLQDEVRDLKDQKDIYQSIFLISNSEKRFERENSSKKAGASLMKLEKYFNLEQRVLSQRKQGQPSKLAEEKNLTNRKS